MKNFLIFAGGVATGVFLTILFSIAVVYFGALENDPVLNQQNTEYKYFEEPGDIFNEREFEVFQVITDNAALARAQSEPGLDIYAGVTILITNDEGKMYYDDEIIKVKNYQVARQVGIYKYTDIGSKKTVPIVKIMKK